jgi:hypothetical protein
MNNKMPKAIGVSFTSEAWTNQKQDLAKMHPKYREKSEKSEQYKHFGRCRDKRIYVRES